MGTKAESPDVDVTASTDEAPARAFAPGASVVLLAPRKLRGTVGVVRRRLAEGWEVEVRTALGTPMHLTLPERDLHLR
ncbi:hypothetical protein [Amnibacterium kyonggiense]|uniref:Uncharacterized protein n=1 Tax=Amnibacterium kyonggiense TaxID=595671 RepID=A0A4R7FDA4_9MICO|nr:hypothetical protein [Amnibacterium kyonggiense]TDS74925.1 hypothetical protein CLV52_3449 [Amnibacterium kyonggiense]